MLLKLQSGVDYYSCCILFWCAQIVFFESGTIHAQTDLIKIDPIQVTDEPVMIDLKPHLMMWVDSSGDSSFPEIQSKQADFVPYEPDLANSYSQESHFWLYVKICGAPESSKWYLGFIYPRVEYYRSVDGGPWEFGLYGYNVKNQKRTERIGPDLFIPIRLEPNQCYEYYFYCSPRLFVDISHGRMLNFHCILSNRTYIGLVQRAVAIKSLPLASILLTIFFYHLILFFYNREKSFLYLSIFSLSCGLLILNNGGHLVELFHVQFIGSYLKIVPGTLWAMIAVASPFTLSYLNLPSAWNMTKVVKILGWIWLTHSLLTFLSLILSDERLQDLSSLMSQTYFFNSLIFYPFYLSVGLLAKWKGNERANFYLLGFGTWFICAFLQLLFQFKIIPGFAVTPTSLGVSELWVIGVTIGMLLFSFGLAQQFKTLQDERAEADKQKALANQSRLLDQKEAARLKEIDQFKSQLYTNITHEFRTPLTVISGMAEQLPDESEERELIHRNAEQLLDLVNQMLELGKIDAGKLTPATSQMDVIPILKYFSSGYLQFAKSQKKHFHLEVLDDVIWMDIDPDMLARICHNLVHNAIKFSPPGGQVKMRVQKIEQDQTLHLQVSDQGRGIPARDLERIFDRFYQVDASNTRHGDGTGIGLALVREITQLLSGSVTVQSAEHQGSIFTVVLPIEHNAEIASWSPKKIRDIGKTNRVEMKINQPTTTYKILIVEDHADVRSYLRQLLTATYQIDLADNGRTGLSKAFEIIPDLIISDVMMPEMDGFQFCETIKNDARTSHIPIILLTAKSTQEDKLDGLQGGADAYLVKPFDRRELFLRTEKLLEHREKVRQHYQEFQMLPQDEIKENKFLENVRTQLEANLCNEQYQIEDLAQEMHLGRVQLFRKLRALTGKTYTQLLREMRINRAKALLLKTDKTSSEIAFEVGFKDGSYFGKVFKKEVGISAGAFRNNTI